MDINYGYGFFVDTTPQAGSPTWAEVANGIENFDKGMNEVVNDFQFLSGKGWGSSEVTGGQLVITLTGRRVRGDAAQDFIYNPALRYNFGDSRKTRFKFTSPGGYAITGPCTLANIESSGGDSTDGTAISFDVKFNGKPSITSALGFLMLVSAPGSAGATVVTVTPGLTAGNEYVYKTAATVAMPEFNEVLTDGWTSWDGAAQIPATSGNELVIAEVTSAGQIAQKAGKVIVSAGV